ncbi:MAG TPA: response regulator transcription factor [Acidimicrobiia bacterium]
MTLRVVVVDDQELVRTGFRLILEAEDDIEVVAEAGDGAAAVRVVREAAPDVVLMDVRMPVMDGIEATKEICAAGVGAPRVLILTTFDLDEYVFGALRAGASGFLLKDTPADDLVAGVRIVAHGDGLLAPSVTRRLIAEFTSRGGGRPSQVVGLDSLTEREVEVLRHLARGLSNAEIARALWVSETTVKTHVSHILTKLDLRDRVQAVVAAYESGLVQAGGSPG